MQKTEHLSSLYPRFGSRIYRFLRRLTQDDLLAEDLTQETFLRATEGFGAFRGDGKASNWLYRIATNVFRDHLRKRADGEPPLWEEAQSTEADEDVLSALPDSHPLPSELAERGAVTQCVRDCIGVLPAPYRAALLLYAVEGKSVEESATILGCSKGAVKVRLYRARRLFKELAAEHCEVSADDRGGDVVCLPKRSVRRPVPSSAASLSSCCSSSVGDEVVTPSEATSDPPNSHPNRLPSSRR